MQKIDLNREPRAESRKQRVSLATLANTGGLAAIYYSLQNRPQ